MARVQAQTRDYILSDRDQTRNRKLQFSAESSPLGRSRWELSRVGSECWMAPPGVARGGESRLWAWQPQGYVRTQGAEPRETGFRDYVRDVSEGGALCARGRGEAGAPRPELGGALSEAEPEGSTRCAPEARSLEMLGALPLDAPLWGSALQFQLLPDCLSHPAA